MVEPPRKAQFQLVQALRGLAALWVVLFHIYESEYIKNLAGFLPKTLSLILFEYGSSGVAIFFVLSGLVIAHSLTGSPMDGRELLQFGLRRSLRLDPPYWAAIALSLSVTALMTHVHGGGMARPAFGTIARHLLYLQEIVPTPNINIVFWTLTFEFQFYVVLAAAHYLASSLATKMGEASAQAIVETPLAILAFFAAIAPSGWAPHGLFVNLWHAFFLGIAAYRAGYQRRSPALLLCLAAVTVIGAQYHKELFGTPAAITALALFVAGRTGYLINGLRNVVLDFLGGISYSLYLVHVPLMIIGFGIWGRVIGHSIVGDFVGLCLILGCLIVAAYAFWWLVERPSHRFATGIFRSRQNRGVFGTIGETAAKQS